VIIISLVEDIFRVDSSMPFNLAEEIQKRTLKRSQLEKWRCLNTVLSFLWNWKVSGS